MIRAAWREDEPLVYRLAAQAATGGVLAAGFTLKMQNPRLPQQIYVVGQESVVAVDGAEAAVYGALPNTEELGLFLNALGCARVLSSGFAPPGWLRQILCELAVSAAFAGEPASHEEEAVFSVPPGECCRLLWQQEGYSQNAAARRWFYSWLCTRVTHGYAHALGIRRGRALVAVAVVCGQPGTGFYLSDVYTAPACRNRGYATRLVDCAVVRFATTRLCLMAVPAVAPFYTRRGFAEGKQVLLATAPAQDMPKEEISEEPVF